MHVENKFIYILANCIVILVCRCKQSYYAIEHCIVSIFGIKYKSFFVLLRLINFECCDARHSNISGLRKAGSVSEKRARQQNENTD